MHAYRQRKRSIEEQNYRETLAVERKKLCFLQQHTENLQRRQKRRREANQQTFER